MVKHDKEKNNLQQENENPMTDEKSQQNVTTDNNSSPADETSATTSNIETEEGIPGEEGADSQAQQIDEKDMTIKSLKEKNEELNDRYLRLFSEFDNFRKRTIKEKQELTKTASADVMEAILPVVDDLHRAYQSAIENPDIDTLTEGLNLIVTKLNTTLKHKGLEEIPSIGEIFNTDYHEAITHIPAPEKKDKGKVIDEVQKGYLLNGKVLRFAKVVVAN